MHSLMNVPYDLIWIVVEAGGATNETTSLIAKSGLRTIHIGFNGKMPVLWEDRHKLESRMRLHALSNMHSLELFDEIQNVKWVGAVSVGILAHSGGSEDGDLPMVQRDNNEKDEKKSEVPVQGPACNSTNHLVGWHTFNTSPYLERSARYIGDRQLCCRGSWSGLGLY
ncbi:UNVERIFIED_CONTAM: putative beta-1,4-xylosyltransferase IRX14H [Sesamum radiatum]|uniref:Glycosyltransferases n=1 Tax=Sesamum radiatum TaxID=300843 RepID=A0AAW2P7F3_SESRA